MPLDIKIPDKWGKEGDDDDRHRGDSPNDDLASPVICPAKKDLILVQSNLCTVDYGCQGSCRCVQEGGINKNQHYDGK